ncbi:ABC transporter permease [Arthrobacter castelli]|uniref:ABC transporter permease n=1 Tax=Arthrobacter castelli TaxID=271431 RepID=UPI000425C0F9|nr:ABC transporter permease [Arthrobacter castelli]
MSSSNVTASRSLNRARDPDKPWRPNTFVLGCRRTVVEIVLFNRDVASLFFILLFPILIMGLFSTVFGDEPTFGAEGDVVDPITPAQYYLPGLIALGTILSGFQNLSGYVAAERYNGAIKRLAGTPLPPLSYFIGKTGLTLYLIVTQTVLLLLFAGFVMDVPMPTDPQQWFTFAWVLLLSTGAWSMAGIAFACLAKSAQSAATLTVLPVLLLSFTSGVYFPFHRLPEWLQNIANVTPLRWTASGMRSVFLPEGWEMAEPGQAWHLGLSAVVILLWLIVGLVVVRLTFKWPPQK